jgi:hypothetical protein
MSSFLHLKRKIKKLKKKRLLFIILILIISLIALIALYACIDIRVKNERTYTVYADMESVSVQYDVSERIKDMFFNIENIFSAAEIREIFNSNMFLLLNQNKIDELTSKFDKGVLTADEKAYIKSFYEDIAKYGVKVYPEAGQILRHYIQGGGDDLEISSAYFFKSSLIKNILESNRDKELIGPVYLNADSDPRIIYAVNAFYIRNIPSKREIYKRMDFNDEDYVSFDFRGIKVRFPHRLIRVFEEESGAKAFTLRIME